MKRSGISSAYSFSVGYLTALVAMFFMFCAGYAPAAVVPVSEIRVEGLYSISEEELLYLLGISAGRSLDPDTATEGIKRAFHKKIFDYISVEEDDKERGLIRVVVKEKDFIEEIIIKGNKRLSSRFIKEHLGVREGEAVRYNRLDSLKSALLRAIAEKGLPDAIVALTVKKTEKPYRVNLVVSVDEGIAVLVERIEILGPDPEYARDLLRLEPGEVFDQFRLREEIGRMTGRYKKNGFLNPAVGPYTFKDGVLHLPVEPGPKLSISIKGNRALSARTLRRVMPFADIGEVRDDLIEETVSKMAALYRAKGYPFVQIVPLVSGKENVIVLNFFIHEGEKIRVKEIIFSGISVPAKNLKGIMSLREGGAYNPDLLPADMNSIEEFYSAIGYADADVPAGPDVRIKDSWAVINISVKEGPRAVIAGFKAEGAEALTPEEILKTANIIVGEPYNEVDISGARRRVVAEYRKNGFSQCSIEIGREFVDGGVYITFRIAEGPQRFFGKTVIAGNASTKREVIRRELLYKEGMPLDETLIMKTRQGLYKLNLFTDVDMELLNAGAPETDTVISVTEGKPGTFEFGFGYGEYEKYRGFFDISYRNLSGMNRTVSFRTELSSIERRYILSYGEPWFLGRPIPMNAFLMREERKEKNIDTGDIRYRLERHTAGLGIQKRLSDRVRLDLSYEFSLTETFDVLPDVILSKDDTGTLVISSITPSISYDTRDDPFDPQRGILAGLSLKTASNVLFSETDFIKLTVHSSLYKRLIKWLVLAVSLRGGAAEGFRDTEELPIVERFFLGGRNTVRGFDQDSIGPVGPLGTPLGGDVFLLGNTELRVRVSKSWRLVGFLDSGNVWPNVEDTNIGDFRESAGLGVRYGTPVGPVRLDYGWKIEPEPGESPGELHFSLGHAF